MNDKYRPEGSIGADIGAAATTSANLALLDDIIGAQSSTGVDSLGEINNLARIANAIQLTAAGGTPNPALTPADLALIGITGVTADNLSGVLQSIANQDNSGSATDTLSELQSLVDATNTAVAVIRDFAQANTASAPTAPTGTAPVAADYTNAGVTGVDANNLAAINDALATASITGTQADTPAEIQTIVNAYNAILAEANGATADATPGVNPTAAQFASIGAAATTPANLALLDDIIGAQTSTGVDSVGEINNLARIANAIQLTAAGGTPNPALTAADFTAIGVTGISNVNLAAMLVAITAQNNDGSATSSLAQLQALIDTTPPAAPTIDATLAGNDVVSAAEATSGFDITGTGEVGATVHLTLQSGITLAGGNTAVVAQDGTWTIHVTAADVAAMGQGAELITASQTDTWGNSGSTSTHNISVDTAPPTAPTLALGTGVSNGATAAEATALTGAVTVLAETGSSTVVTFTNGVNTVTKLLTGTGSAQAVVLDAADLVTLGNGTISVSAVATDAQGNTSNAGSSSFVLDTAPPAAPTLALGTGISNGATAAEATALTGAVTVLAETGSSTVVTFTNGVHTVTKLLTGNGSAQAVVLDAADLVTLGDGTVSVSATTTDAAGNTSGAGSSSFVLDTTPPATPVLTFSDQSGSSTLKTTGTVAVSLAVDVSSWEYSTDGGLNWNAGTGASFALNGTSYAVGSVKVRGYDQAGNVSVGSNANALTVNHAPTLNASASPSMGTVDTTGTLNAPSGAVGTLVSALIASSGIANYSDADASTTVGMAITGYNTTLGTLYFSTNGGTTWSTWTSAASSALHLTASASTRLYFLANASAAGDPAITFRAWDGSDAVANGTSSAISANGGSTAYSSSTDTIGMSLQGIYTPSAASIPLNQGTTEGTNAEITNFNGDGFMDLLDGDWRGSNAMNLRLGSSSGVVDNRDSTYNNGQTGQSKTNGTALDFNGDGYGDVLVNDSVGGTVSLFQGNSAGTLGASTNFTSAWTGNAAMTSSQVGKFKGDYNGDGFQDMLVSDTSGHAFIVYGNAAGSFTGFDGNTASAGVAFTGNAGFATFAASVNQGSEVATTFVGDSNRDGLSDIAFANYSEGKVYIKFGTATQTASQSITSATVGSSTGNGFVVSGLSTTVAADASGRTQGVNVATAGYMNGDGYADLLIMDPASHAAYVVYGKANGSVADIDVTTMTSSQGFKAYATNNALLFGTNGMSVGDVNGDGYDDIAISTTGMSSNGGVTIIFGGATGAHGNINADSSAASGSWSTPVSFANFSTATPNMGGNIGSTYGDVNGDGLSDFAVGTGGNSGKGSVVLYGDINMSTLSQSAPLLTGSTVSGTTQAERVVGTLSSDTLSGGGGADAITAGAGNDTILVHDDTFLRVDGGTGIDTFKLDSTANSVTLDFTSNGLGAKSWALKALT